MLRAPDWARSGFPVGEWRRDGEGSEVHKTVLAVTRLMAILGGIVLSILILVVCVSVAGRALNGMLHGSIGAVAPDLARSLLDMGVGPINGDFELVESGIAFAIFSFLPLAQVTSSHASVDIFTSFFPNRLNMFLRMIIEIVFAAVLLLIAVQLYNGMLSKMRYGETTFLLQFPIWWAYAASLIGAALAGVVGIYMAAVRVAEFFSNRIIVADGPEVDH